MCYFASVSCKNSKVEKKYICGFVRHCYFLYIKLLCQLVLLVLVNDEYCSQEEEVFLILFYQCQYPATFPCVRKKAIMQKARFTTWRVTVPKSKNKLHIQNSYFSQNLVVLKISNEDAGYQIYYFKIISQTHIHIKTYSTEVQKCQAIGLILFAPRKQQIVLIYAAGINIK